MDLKDIEAFIALAKKEGVSSLKYESKDVKLSVTLQPPSPVLMQAFPPAVMNSHIPQNNEVRSAPARHQADSGLHKITSPFVGTFYTSPSPGEPAYAKVGDRVKKGQVLCIVEAMKIMNEIDSDVAGEVVEICVENESLVEYGQVLFLIKV